MTKIRIQGAQAPLSGSVSISGAKNSALKLICASLLSEKTLSLNNVPALADVTTLVALLDGMGVDVAYDAAAKTMDLTAANVKSPVAPYELVRKMRASITVLGPLLSRFGKARVAFPGGCQIGARPIEQHLKGFEAMGAKIEIDNGDIVATTSGGLKGATIEFPFVTVSATENLMMAAVLAKGTTTLINCAREPEIPDMAEMLNRMGAKITGAGTSTIVIEGVDNINIAMKQTVMPDRIEAGSYVAAAALVGERVQVTECNPEHIQQFLDHLQSAGVHIETTADSITVERRGPLRGTDMMTTPFPGVATDLQAQYMTVMSLAEGASLITETVFENRFMHVPELTRMGADITVHAPSSAIVRGVTSLKGAPVSATDLRASFSLVMAGIVAKGETIVDNIHHLDRGYAHLEDKFRGLGAQVERIEG